MRAGRRLPRLLDAYRKYGSRASGSVVVANQRCSSGALADSAKNGSPIETMRVQDTEASGRIGEMGIHPVSTRTGSTTSGNARINKCNAACFLIPSQVVVAYT